MSMVDGNPPLPRYRTSIFIPGRGQPRERQRGPMTVTGQRSPWSGEIATRRPPVSGRHRNARAIVEAVFDATRGTARSGRPATGRSPARWRPRSRQCLLTGHGVLPRRAPTTVPEDTRARTGRQCEAVSRAEPSAPRRFSGPSARTETSDRRRVASIRIHRTYPQSLSPLAPVLVGPETRPGARGSAPPRRSTLPTGLGTAERWHCIPRLLRRPRHAKSPSARTNRTRWTRTAHRFRPAGARARRTPDQRICARPPGRHPYQPSSSNAHVNAPARSQHAG